MSACDPFPDNALWIAAYADAQSAIERMAERRRLSPVRQPWRTRRLVAERLALARMDGQTITDFDFMIDRRGTAIPSPFDMTRWRSAVGRRISLKALMGDGVALLDWLGFTSEMPIGRSGAMTDILDAVAGWQRAADALPPSLPLVHGARLARLWHSHAPVGQGDMTAGLLVGDRWGPGRWGVSSGGLVALGLENSAAPWRRASADMFDLAWLQAIKAGANIHLDLEIRLRSYAVRAQHGLARRRRPGRLKDVLWMAMVHPRLTSRQVAKALDLTSAGAIKLLTIATEEGLLIEQSGQASYRSYGLPVSMTYRPAAHDDLDGRFGDDFWSSAENEVSPEAR